MFCGGYLPLLTIKGCETFLCSSESFFFRNAILNIYLHEISLSNLITMLRVYANSSLSFCFVKKTPAVVNRTVDPPYRYDDLPV